MRVMAQEIKVMLLLWFPNFKGQYLKTMFFDVFSFVFFKLVLQFLSDFSHTDINEKRRLN